MTSIEFFYDEKIPAKKNNICIRVSVFSVRPRKPRVRLGYIEILFMIAHFFFSGNKMAAEIGTFFPACVILCNRKIKPQAVSFPFGVDFTYPLR